MIIKRLLILIGFMLIMVGCQEKTTSLDMATGSLGGAYYPIGSRIAEVLSDDINNLSVNAYTGQASVANSKMILESTIDLAIIQSNVSHWAYEGLGTFKDQPVEDIRGLVGLYPEMIQVIVSDESGILSFEDLRGKRISIGPKESGNYFDAINILKAHGITLDDFQPVYLNFEDSRTAMEDQEIDGLFITSGIPTASVTEMNATDDIHLLSMDETVVDALVATYPYYFKTIIPKGTYSDVKEDVLSLSTVALWVCDAELDEDLVYQVVKSFWDNLDTIKMSHRSVEGLEIKDYNMGMSIPLHPGAKKYYDEQKLD